MINSSLSPFSYGFSIPGSQKHSSKSPGGHHSAARPDGGPLQPGPDGPHFVETPEVAARPEFIHGVFDVGYWSG